MFRLIAFLLFATLANCNTEGDILYAQKQAWADPKNVLESWNNQTLVNPCSWLHISCNINSSVVRIDLENAGLSGPLIPQLGQLTYLEYLMLEKNNISGSIPTSFGNLTNLISLDLQSNQLSGVIPSALGNLYSLAALNLKGNMLSGSLPMEILSLVVTGNLTALNVASNNLTGTITPLRTKVATIIVDMETPSS
ncbi:hypothetical protein LUZ60_007903 [Juncus effusus]|nr:hypothetical protein LUZ60_007903 [Juncus effusus]